MTWVKICGMTNLEDAQVAVEAGADAIGFVFADSPRRIDPKVAGEIATLLPAQVEKVGVFVNEKPARIREIVKQAGLTSVQIYGDEPGDVIAQLFPEGERPQLLLESS